MPALLLRLRRGFNIIVDSVFLPLWSNSRRRTERGYRENISTIDLNNHICCPNSMKRKIQHARTPHHAFLFNGDSPGHLVDIRFTTCSHTTSFRLFRQIQSDGPPWCATFPCAHGANFRAWACDRWTSPIRLGASANTFSSLHT